MYAKNCPPQGITWAMTVRISILQVPQRKKTPTEIERIWQGYRKARFHYLQGKTGERESVKSSRNINYTQDKYTAIRHIHTIKIFVSCNYHKFRWDTERYTMNFLILLKLADEWLAQEGYMILKVEGESDFYTDYMAGCWFDTLFHFAMMFIAYLACY